jgi:hypothetical protein
MKVFISYSLGYTDAHVAVLLSQQAQANGITVACSQQGVPWSHDISDTVRQLIGSADVLVAIVSADSQLALNVHNELNTALLLNKPVIALIERGTQMAHVSGIHYVEFDRYNLRPALVQISGILEQHKGKDVKAWILAGGLALLALYLISQE